MGVLSRIKSLWLKLRFGEIRSEVIGFWYDDHNNHELEIYFYGRGGKLIGRRIGDLWDAEFPYRGGKDD